MKEKNIQIIKHIKKYCNEVNETLQAFNNDFSDFSNNFIFRNACSMSILQIGELSTHLTDEFKEANSQIPWRQIRGMRNIFAHDYGNINIKMLWNTLKEDIPMLSQFCEKAINNYELLNAEAHEIEYKNEKDEWE